MKKIFLISALTLTTLLSGCMTYGPGTEKFESMSGRIVYGQVNSFLWSIDEACSDKSSIGSPYCADKRNWVWLGALVGQHGMGLLYKSALAVPKDARIHNGDIIAYRSGTDSYPWPKFDHVAHRATQIEDPSCRWVGSHFSTGGVVCEGWRWDKDYAPLAD